MAGIVGVFASIGEHIPILKKEKFNEPFPEGTISRFHYRGTVMIIMAFCILVTSTEWISGTDSIINCLHQGPIPENVIESYCYIMGTFSVPRHYVDYHTDVGNRVAGTGVGPYDPESDYIEIKAYYQWVPFMLFLQGVMFYVPHVIYKFAEGGKIKLILAGMNLWVINNDERKSKEEELASYLVETRGNHREWTLKVLAAQALYLINVVGQIFFTDCFLGWEFHTYGVSALSFLEEQPKNRVDPMSRVFPRMTKCTFSKYGPSGTIQRHDAQCVLPINIINEKIYVFLWFWFGLLSALTALHFLWSLGIVFAFRARRTIIRRKLSLHRQWKKLEVDIDLICRSFDFGDWKLFYHLLRNMDYMIFGEFMEHYTRLLQRSLDENGKDDTLSLNSLLKMHKPSPCSVEEELSGPPLKKKPGDSDEESEFLQLKDSNYLSKAKEAGEQV